jgi:hypothetical protein
MSAVDVTAIAAGRVSNAASMDASGGSLVAARFVESSTPISTLSTEPLAVMLALPISARAPRVSSEMYTFG